MSTLNEDTSRYSHYSLMLSPSTDNSGKQRKFLNSISLIKFTFLLYSFKQFILFKIRLNILHVDVNQKQASLF